MASAPHGSSLRQESDRERPSPAETRDQLERILASPAFQASARRRTLLRYLVEEALAGRAERLKGFTIAVAVFGRDESFDPQTDPVVRLEARRLRRDLDGYYATSGRGDAVCISVPKGGYVPEVDWRDDGEPVDSPPAAADEARGSGTTHDSAAAPPATNAASEVPPRPATTVPADKPVDPTSRSRVLRLGLLALASVLIALVAGHILFGDHESRPGETTTFKTQEHGPAVIVLPFEPLGPSEEDRHLAGGLTQQLMTDLMRFDAFRIYATADATGKGAPVDPLELGRQLAVVYIVRGNVRSDGGMVRVGTQLIDGKTGELLWSETYDSRLVPDNLLIVQENVASEIATRLGEPYGVVRSVTAEHLTKHRPRTLFAYQCVLRVYDYRRAFSRERHAETQACLEEAVRQDPEYAEAWAFLGWLRMDPVRFGIVKGDAAAREMNRALSETSHAVRLAPKNSVALQASAVVAWYRGDHEQSERIQRQALALNPNDPEILAQLGWRLAARGRWDEGLGYLSRAIDRTVSPPAWYFALFAMHDYLQGNYVKALANAERAKVGGFGIGWSLVAVSHAALGNQKEAREAVAQMSAVSPALAQDPAAAYRIHQIIEPTIDALVAGLRKAGWTEPPTVDPDPDDG